MDDMERMVWAAAFALAYSKGSRGEPCAYVAHCTLENYRHCVKLAERVNAERVAEDD